MGPARPARGMPPCDIVPRLVLLPMNSLIVSTRRWRVLAPCIWKSRFAGQGRDGIKISPSRWIGDRSDRRAGHSAIAPPRHAGRDGPHGDCDATGGRTGDSTGHAPVEVHSVNGVSRVFAPPTRRERAGNASATRLPRLGGVGVQVSGARPSCGGEATVTRHIGLCRASIGRRARYRRRCGERRRSIAQGRSEIGHVGQYRRREHLRHCERSETIHRREMDCFAPLAMTISGFDS